ncbi:MAG: hypothetical protein FJ405_09015 [Verrucomicrobia bacterium]|nr:hypothetical protein [Verrucomicrobiota bacterium]
MEKLKQLGERVKSDYAKLLLIFTVLGLAVAVVVLYFLSLEEQQKATDITMNYERARPKPPPSLDMQRYTSALEASVNPGPVDFGLPHKLFNPVKWIRSPEGRIIADRTGKSIGPEAIKIENIRPLNRVVKFLDVVPEGYSLELTFEAAARVADARPRVVTVNTNQDNKVRIPGGTPRMPNQLILKEVKGSAEAPDALVFEIADSKEQLVITKDRPSIKAEAYVADMSYAPENRHFRNQKRDAMIGFAGEEYKIVEITENEVVVSNRLNDKKTRLKRTP